MSGQILIKRSVSIAAFPSKPDYLEGILVLFGVRYMKDMYLLIENDFTMHVMGFQD